MSNKNTWSSWCDIDYSSAAHHGDIKQKAAYDTRLSKSIGGGCHMPAVEIEGMADRLYLVDPVDKNPARENIEIDGEGITTNVMREERLAIVSQWVRTKNNELAIRKDARFATSLFIPIPNQLDARDAVRFGDQLCRSLFADHQYSFSVHSKETIVKKQITGGKVGEFARKNNHIHIMFSERSLATGKKGTGASRPFKGKDKLRRMVVAKSDEILSKKFGVTIRKPNGYEKKIRISRGQYFAQQQEEKLRFAVLEAENERADVEAKVEQYEHDCQQLEGELLALERTRDGRQDRRRQITEAARQGVLDRFSRPTETAPRPAKSRDDAHDPGRGMDR